MTYELEKAFHKAKVKTECLNRQNMFYEETVIQAMLEVAIVCLNTCDSNEKYTDASFDSEHNLACRSIRASIKEKFGLEI